MKAAVLRFPRQSLRAVLEQPRRAGSDARRVRRDPVIWLAIGMDALVLVALVAFWWMLVRRG